MARLPRFGRRTSRAARADRDGSAADPRSFLTGWIAHCPQFSSGTFEDTMETTRASLDDVRRIAKQLRPEALDDLGLVPALNALATTFADRTGLRIRRQLPNTPPELGKEDELVFFRAAQEGLTNLARHAETERVDLILQTSPSAIILRVRDYGVGIDGPSAGSGIRGMRERALLVGADLTIGAAPGGGTEVTLALPLERRQ